MLMPSARGARQAAAAAGGATISFGNSYASWSSSTSHTFSSASFPDAETGRVCVVMIGGESSSVTSLTSVTVGGNTATIIQNVSIVDRAFTAIAAYQMDSGTSADVVLNFTVAPSEGVSISTYSLLGVDGVTQSDLDAGGSDPSTGDTTTVNIPAGSVALSVGSNGSVRAYTWSGATEDADINGGVWQHSSASVAATGSDRSTHVVATTHATSNAGASLLTAVWDAA